MPSAANDCFEPKADAIRSDFGKAATPLGCITGTSISSRNFAAFALAVGKYKVQRIWFDRDFKTFINRWFSVQIHVKWLRGFKNHRL